MAKPTEESGPDAGIELDADQISPAALRGLVEEYVTREGTDYGHSDWTLEDKVEQVFRQLDSGEARIVFDPELESASIVAAPEQAAPTREVERAGDRASDRSRDRREDQNEDRS